MDFVGFETFTEHDVLPAPQPSLPLPLKSNIETLGAKLPNLKDLKSLLQSHAGKDERAEEDSGVQLADKYAKLSLSLLDDSSSSKDDKPTDSTAHERLRTDALSLRLSRALNPSISDTRMRELFENLEPMVSERPELVNSGIDGSIARKNLRGAIEVDLLSMNSKKLAEYSKVVKNLEYLGTRLGTLTHLVEETNQVLVQDTEATAGLRAEIGACTSEKTAINLKKSLLTTFRQKFTLNEYEQFLLTSGELNADFFVALKRAECITEECSVLLALDNPALGNQIMTSTNALIEKAKKNITLFCTKSLSDGNLQNSKGKLSTLHSCLRHLKERPEQLKAIMDAFVQSRSSVLLDDFKAQVSGQENNGNSKNHETYRPVYLSSHDPVRFITDLLAYVHSSAANESEIISGILQNEEYPVSTINEIVNQVMRSLATPVKAKIEEIITLEPKLSVLYSMFNILELYLVMFNKDAHAQVISSSIQDAIDMIQEKFKILLSNRLATIEESNSAKLDLSSDLQPPEWIIEYYSDILPLIDTMKSPTILGLSSEKHDELVGLITDRPITIFQKHLDSMSSEFTKREKTLFTLNFLDLIVSKIVPLSLLGDKMLEINHTINDYAETIKEDQFQTLLSDCGLTDYYNIMNMICPTEDDFAEASLYAAVKESKVFDQNAVAGVNETIQAVIPTALLDIQSNLMKLNNPIIVNEIMTFSTQRFVRFYRLFAGVIEEYVSTDILTWSPQEIAALLGVGANDDSNDK
ncbi:hypothetical protein OXX80_008585 [Metschnikowia pulcherrima]